MPALGAGIHVFCASSEDVDGTGTRACPSSEILSAASRVNPTCGDKPGHDATAWFDVNGTSSNLDAHIAAIRLPKAAHRRFGDAVVVGGNARAAHFHHRENIRGGGDRALNKAGRGAILHRDIAG